MCESGGNYAINTGNGYYGAYQFDPAPGTRWATAGCQTRPLRGYRTRPSPGSGSSAAGRHGPGAPHASASKRTRRSRNKVQHRHKSWPQRGRSVTIAVCNRERQRLNLLPGPPATRLPADPQPVDQLASGRDPIQVAADFPGLKRGLGSARSSGPPEATGGLSRTPTPGSATTAASTRSGAPGGRAPDRCRGRTSPTAASSRRSPHWDARRSHRGTPGGPALPSPAY